MIETARFRLRPHRVEDFNRYLPLWLTPEPASPVPLPSLNQEEIWARLLRWIGHWHEFGFGMFIAEDRETDEIIAEAGLAHFKRGVGENFDNAPEAGWRVLATRRGEGIAVEVMTAVMEWFDARSIASRTVCLIHDGNVASVRVASRIGFNAFGSCEFKGHRATLFERMHA
jgi:RimJ/RimL family protein N-acetyltransferase